MGFSVMLWGAEKLVPVEYWCPYGTCVINWILTEESTLKLVIQKVETLHGHAAMLHNQASSIF